MSKGTDHDRACRLLSAIALLGTISPNIPPGQSIPFAIGAFMGQVLSPDLDIPTRNNAGKRWGAIGLGYVWYLYAKAIPHRSFLSHGPVVGTVIRLMYLGAIAIASLFCVSYFRAYALNQLVRLPSWHLAQAWLWLSQWPTEWYAFAFAGLCMADILHGVMDAASSSGNGKRKRKQDKRGKQSR